MNFTLDEAFVAVDENDAKKLALILKECPKFLNQYGEKGPWTGGVPPFSVPRVMGVRIG